MGTRLRLAGAASIALMLAACNPGGPARPGTGGATNAEALALIEKPALGDGIEALPRLAGDSPAIARINAELDRSDAAAVENARACTTAAGDGPGGGWSRTITRPMTGPAYVTLREHLEIYCGGPYPATSQTAVTYDIAAGGPIDWARAIPGLGLAFHRSEGEETGEDRLTTSRALGAWYSRKMLAGTDAESIEQCRDVFDPEDLADQTFNIWADAGNGGVTVQPDFPHVIQACADSATMTPGDLRRFRADPRLVEAIVAAHAAGHWAPKEDPAAE